MRRLRMGIYSFVIVGSPLPRYIGINDLAGNCEIISWNQQLTGKIFHPKELRAVLLSKS